MVGGTGEAGGGATAARARAVSDALEAARRGDQEALSRLFTEVYDELHELAHLQRRRWSGNHTLDTTALLHESYLRLVDRSRFEWRDLGHFFAVACKAMRHILIDYARTRQALKRGGDQEQVPLADAAAGPGGDPEAVIALCEGLERLAAADPRQASVFELRFFLGLSVEETAELLAVSPATVKRDWLLASTFLRVSMEA
ncbi:MAG TPA: ECF-type sigma factor [Kofleriaceae bacterium]|nr:ECF-type sigma factor [Kofleriaceae bacterium]